MIADRRGVHRTCPGGLTTHHGCLAVRRSANATAPRSLVREQTREKQRLEKILEDAQIKLGSIIRDVHGVSGRQMLEAMIAGQRDPHVLADLAHGRMRVKILQLRQALTGHFEDHHAFICAAMLRRIDALGIDIAHLDAKVEELIAPFAPAVDRLDEIPGRGQARR